MPDEGYGAEWLPTRMLVAGPAAAPANGAAKPRRRLDLSREACRSAGGTPWRRAAKVIFPAVDDANSGSTAILATATGVSITDGSATTNVTVLTYPVGYDEVISVEEVIVRPGSELGYDFMQWTLVDGGTSGQGVLAGRQGEVINRAQSVFVDRSGIVPTWFVVAGETIVYLQGTTTDPEGATYVEVEMRGFRYDARQFREIGR